MLQYKAVTGQSLLDICLNTYGSFDLLTKLIEDNGIDNANYTPFSGQVFVWDEKLTVDQAVNQQTQNSNIAYATADSINTQARIIDSNGSGEIVVHDPNTDPSTGNDPNQLMPMYLGSVENENPSEVTVKAMDSINALKANQTIVYNVNGRRFCFAFPSVYGNLASIKDTNGFEILSGFVKTATDFTINGIVSQYSIYTLHRAATVSGFTVTFIF